jgi:hypothetical protein
LASCRQFQLARLPSEIVDVASSTPAWTKEPVASARLHFRHVRPLTPVAADILRRDPRWQFPCSNFPTLRVRHRQSWARMALWGYQ